MSTLAHNAVYTSYSAPAKAPAPPAERVVHSTLFSAYDVASSSVAMASMTPSQSWLLTRWDAWCTARKNAREERELLALAEIDPRVRNELNCLLSHHS